MNLLAAYYIVSVAAMCETSGCHDGYDAINKLWITLCNTCFQFLDESKLSTQLFFSDGVAAFFVSRMFGIFILDKWKLNVSLRKLKFYTLME